MIEIVNVTKVFNSGENSINAVENVSLKIDKGHIHGIIGYSGAGKSTLIRCINLLERPTKGKILFKGEDLTSLKEKDLRDRRKNMGMIFQHFNLMNSRNVFHNVAYPLKDSKLTKEEKKIKVRELLELVGLSDKEEAYPSQLSGGQKQRVAIARALANDPEVLLCDEATSALDPKTTMSILKLLKELKEKLGLTIIIITHEMEVVKEICHRVSIMEDGKIIESGEIIKIFSQPEKEATREFLGSSSNRNKILEILNLEDNIFNIEEDDVLTRVQYLGSITKEALISEASRRFEIHASILYGNIGLLDNTPLGELIILFTGEASNIEESLRFFRDRGLIVEVIEHGRSSTKVYT